MQGVIDGMSRALFLCAYADRQEELAEDDPTVHVASHGEDWNDIAPETPMDAIQEACILYGHIESQNNLNMACLLARACKVDGVEFPPSHTYEEEFGHYLAMMCLGHGVSWFDDHARFDIEIPHFEYHID